MDSTRDRVRVRTATPADADAIADVHTASIRELGGEAYDDPQIRAWLANVHPDRYPLSEPGFRLVVAEREADAEIVGFGQLDLEPSDDASTGRIGAVYVRPDHAREGVGRAILETLEETAREAGLEVLTLTASKNAVEFYDGQGYEAAETAVLEMQEGVPLECLRMRKRLGAD